MVKASICHLSKLAFLAALFVCAIVPILAAKPASVSLKVLELEPKVDMKEFVIEVPNMVTQNGENDGGVLRCANAGAYCNNIFGTPCCGGWGVCIPPTSFVGGVCAA